MPISGEAVHERPCSSRTAHMRMACQEALPCRCVSSLVVKWKRLLTASQLVRACSCTTLLVFLPSVVSQVVRPSQRGMLLCMANSAMSFFLFSYQASAIPCMRGCNITRCYVKDAWLTGSIRTAGAREVLLATTVTADNPISRHAIPPARSHDYCAFQHVPFAS